MAEVRPLRALRFTDKAGDVSTCVCPPYDIISASERSELIKSNENNLVRLELPEGEDRYAAAAETLKAMIGSGVIARDEEESFFIYREIFDALGAYHTLTGIVGRVKLCDFSEKTVLPHEETLKKAKLDRFDLMCATGCNFSSVYSLYDGSDGKAKKAVLSAVDSRPLYDFTDRDGVRHMLWRVVSKEIIKNIEDAFKDKQLFIADGHHRYETALNYRDHLKKEGRCGDDAEYVLMTLVDMDDPGLVVFPTHRLITGIAVDAKELAAKCSDHFDCSERALDSMEADLAANSEGHAFALYTGGGRYTLMKAKKSVDGFRVEGRSKAYCGLDVSILHTLVLEGCLGIDRENMALQRNLRYTRSAAEAISEVDRGSASAAFIINATKVGQIRDVALAGDKMPQKSTYFYPKLITGLVMNVVDPEAKPFV